MIDRAKKYGIRNAKKDNAVEVTKAVIKETSFQKLNLVDRQKAFAREYVVNQWLQQFNKLKTIDQKYDEANKIIASVTFEMIK